LTWYIGTIGIMHAVVSRRRDDSGIAEASACSTVERCEYRTAFGSPVVPDV
jgi:hypothetical protein